MPVLNVEKIGLVANFSEKGDWAFNLAYQLAKSQGMQLNIFRFQEDPCSIPLDIAPNQVQVHGLTEEEWVKNDRELREYYDRYLEDYEDAGFKICEGGRHNLELRRCLKHKEYQLLVIPYLNYGMTFGNMRIEEFAYRFGAPVILVGPKQPGELHLNQAAEIICYKLDLPSETWKPIREPRKMQSLPVI